MKLDISYFVCESIVMSIDIFMFKFRSTEMSSGSHDLLKFWEISANISETVQDRDKVTMED